MLIEHLGKLPEMTEGAYVAPDATLCGEVSIGAGARVMHGARLIAEGGRIAVGENAIIMQNAVVRAIDGFDCVIGSSVIVGPTAHVVGATIEEEVFLATGSSIFHGSRIGTRSVVRINGVVHVNSCLRSGSIVPIGWIAVGDPAELFSPDRHDELWSVQKELKFVLTAYGIDRPLNDCMAEVTARVSNRLKAHRDDAIRD